MMASLTSTGRQALSSWKEKRLYRAETGISKQDFCSLTFIGQHCSFCTTKLVFGHAFNCILIFFKDNLDKHFVQPICLQVFEIGKAWYQFIYCWTETLNENPRHKAKRCVLFSWLLGRMFKPVMKQRLRSMGIGPKLVCNQIISGISFCN